MMAKRTNSWSRALVFISALPLTSCVALGKIFNYSKPQFLYPSNGVKTSQALEEEMATDSSILAWKIPWPGEPDGSIIVHVVFTKSWTQLSMHTIIEKYNYLVLTESTP